MNETEKFWKERTRRRYSTLTELERLGEAAVRELEEKVKKLEIALDLADPDVIAVSRDDGETWHTRYDGPALGGE